MDIGDFELMSKKSCVIYDSWADMILNLPAEMAGEFAQGILRYAIYGEDIDTQNPAITAMLVPVKKKLDEDAEAYKEVKKKRTEAANRRWSENNQMQTNAKECTCMQVDPIVYKNNQMQTNAKECTCMQVDPIVYTCMQMDTVSDSVSVYESDKDKKKRFVKPSVEEVREYCQERHNNVDPETFVDFYESKGWKVGSNSMKDWKSAVRTWEKRSDKPVSNKSSPKDMTADKHAKIHNFGNERQVDYNTFEEFVNG